MKRTMMIALLLVSANIGFSQIKFNTGSIEFDKELNTINAKAKLDLKTFKLDVSLSHNLSIPKIDELLKVLEPAEVILAKDIADIVKKPIDDVVKTYKVSKEKGWGAIAKDLGIKPGSPEFHALKNKTKKSNSSNGGGKGNGKSKGKGKKK